MLRKHMASTGLAPFAVAHRGLVVGADVIGTLGHLDRRRLPEAERVDGARGPVTTRLAMAVPHGGRFAVTVNSTAPQKQRPLYSPMAPPHQSGTIGSNCQPSRADVPRARGARQPAHQSQPLTARVSAPAGTWRAAPHRQRSC